jgi:hypothetical protein
MTEKLTAKLSDGTEWEVVRLEHRTYDVHTNQMIDGWKMALLKPLKPSPPKEVWVSYGVGEVWNVETHDFSKEGGYPAHRYVLAEEPKEKPQPREWWEVRYLDDSRPYCSYKSEAGNLRAMLC